METVIILLAAAWAIAYVYDLQTTPVPVKLFPDTGYDYSPSYMTDGLLEKIWWTGSTGAGDVIKYRQRIKAAPWGSIIPVLGPTVSWEGQCTADPTVIRGIFYYLGNTYTYAMYYTASANCKGNNAIGVAFSNDGVNWVKYASNPVISSQSPSASTYGAGQPVAINTDFASSITLFHTDVGSYGTRQFVRYSTDGINFSAPQMVSVSGPGLGSSGGFAAAAWAYDYTSRMHYTVANSRGITVDEVHLSIYRIGDLINGTWELVTDIPQAQQYPWDQFEPGFKTDRYGGITTPNIQVAFAGGRILPWIRGDVAAVNDPMNWDLYTWKYKVARGGVKRLSL